MSNRRLQGESVVNCLLALVAVIAGGVIVRREVGSFSARHASANLEYVAEWRQKSKIGHLTGSPNAVIQVVVLGDYQCPACRRLEGLLDAMRSRFRDTLAVTHLQFPLAYHPYAVAAATAAECAAAQNLFEPMHRRLFELQDSLGKRSFSSIASDVGVRDQEQFTSCMERSDTLPQIRNALRWGQALKIRGTPTVLVNGRMIPGLPNDQALEMELRRALTVSSP